MRYERSQRGHFSIPILAFLGIGMVLLGSADDMSAASRLWVIVTIVLIFLAVLAFDRLDVTVGGGRVVASFWLGWPRRRIELTDVAGIRAVRNSWWHGWGVRKVRNGWMYNVWGLDAVELELASGGVFRIGTDDVDGLVAALESESKRAG